MKSIRDLVPYANGVRTTIKTIEVASLPKSKKTMRQLEIYGWGKYALYKHKKVTPVRFGAKSRKKLYDYTYSVYVDNGEFEVSFRCPYCGRMNSTGGVNVYLLHSSYYGVSPCIVCPRCTAHNFPVFENLNKHLSKEFGGESKE